VATALLPLKRRSKWPSNGRQLPVVRRQNAVFRTRFSFSVMQAATNDNADLNLLLYQVHL